MRQSINIGSENPEASTKALFCKGKLLFVVAEDWYFVSHRLELACSARLAGYDVTVVTRVTTCAEEITSRGLGLIPVQVARHGINVFKDLKFMWELRRIYRREAPDIVHHVAVKPVIFGTLAARWAGVPRVVNALAGMGYLFSSKQPRARILRPFVEQALTRLLNAKNVCTVVQNPDDRRLLRERCNVPDRATALIRGAGVDLHRFEPGPEPSGDVTVVLASRLLWDKGVKEFVEAARILKRTGSSIRFALVGALDEGNPSSIPQLQLRLWLEDKIIEWWRYQKDMRLVFEKAHIVCLPSYREGLPKVLLEAAASGRPIIATDVPGCREVVKHGVNGLLVRARRPDLLAEAIHRLSDDTLLRVRMGREGRRIAEQEFSLSEVTQRTLDLYAEVSAR